MQDADDFLVRKGITLKDYFDDRRPAVLEEDHMAAVNYERYFFADVEGKARFDADPRRFAGKVTDPVSKKRFVPGPASPLVEHAGQFWVFGSQATRERFERRPERYLRPGWTM